MSIFNEWVIKNDLVKRATSFFVFIEGVQLPHDQGLVLEDRTFHCKVLSRLYCNNKFNILANFNLVLSTSIKILWLSEAWLRMFKGLVNLVIDILNSEGELN